MFIWLDLKQSVNNVTNSNDYKYILLQPSDYYLNCDNVFSSNMLYGRRIEKNCCLKDRFFDFIVHESWCEYVSASYYCVDDYLFLEMNFKTEHLIPFGIVGRIRNSDTSTVYNLFYERVRINSNGRFSIHFLVSPEDLKIIDDLEYEFLEILEDYNQFEEKIRSLENKIETLNSSINRLRDVDDINLCPPGLDEPQYYIPLDCSYSHKFFAKLYLLQNYVVSSQIISEYSLLQYQISIKEADEELMLIISGEHYLKGGALFSHSIIGNSYIPDNEDYLLIHSDILSLIKDIEHTLKVDIILKSSVFSNCFQKCESDLLKWIKCNLDKAYNYYKKEYGNVIWKSEYRLFQFVKVFFPDAIYQYRAEWLGDQSLDIYIPSISTCIEYHGEQHFIASSHFGGEQGLIENQERDRRKEENCKNNNIRYLVWNYTVTITYENFVSFIYTYLYGKTETDDYSVSGYLSRGVPFVIKNILLSNDNLPYRKKITTDLNSNSTRNVVCQFDTEGILVSEFESVTDASHKTGIGKTSIYKCLAGQRNKAGGYYWNFVSRNNVPERIDLPDNTGSGDCTNYTNMNKTVVQVSISTGEVLNVYKSINEAAKAMGIDRKGISDVLAGRQKTAGGFYWISENL